MPGLRRSVGLGGVLLIAHLMVAVALVSFSYQPQALVSVLLTLFAGAGWMMTMTSLNSSAQMVLPRAVRARGMACYLTAFAAAMSGGSLLWGSIARQYSLETAMFVAAIVMTISAVVGTSLKIAEPI